MSIENNPSSANNSTGNSPSPEVKKSRRWIITSIVLVVLALLLLRLFTSNGAKRHPMSQSIVAATAHTSTVPIYITAIGTVTPTFSVIVKTQVTGQLLHVLFKEGQIVKKGDLLAQIDARSFEAQLNQFQGQLARDHALLTNAQNDLKRYQKLWKEDSVAKQTLDTQAALVKQYEGTIKLDEGQIQTAQLNITYSNIQSPIDGRVGLRLVDQGNLVQTSDANGLVVINTVNPITVIFSIPEKDVPNISEQLSKGKTLAVQAYNSSQSQLLATGALLTMDNQIDSTTGTIKLKAQFANNDYHLFPNQFVNIKLLVDTLQNATLIPTAALQYGIQGSYVFRLNKNKTVTLVPVKVIAAVGDDSAISTGISAGQSVVVEGADKLVDGAEVNLPTTTKTEKTEKTDHSMARHRKS